MIKMKNSGVEWIGDIPIDWEINKIGSIYEERNTKVSDKDFQPLSVTKKGIVPQLENAAKTDNGDNRKLIKKNDFVINSRSDRRGSCGISEYDGSCSLINTVLKPRKNMSNTYYSYVFRSELFADEFYRWGNGIVDDLWSTKWSNMKNIYIPSPSLETQHRIADYLDKKCAKIDAIIEKQQAVIEKLKEYKLSTITEKIVQNATSKLKLKNMCLLITDGTHFSPELVAEGYPYITAKDVRGRGIDYNSTLKVEKTIYETLKNQGCQPEKGDVLLVKDGATTGRVGLMIDDTECVALSSVAILRPKHEYMSEYLMYVMMSKFVQEQISVSMAGSAMPRTTLTKLVNYWGLTTPIAKQNEIVDCLNKTCSKIDKIILSKERIISRLIEYKTALIYEVVTGKKEV